MKPEIDRDYADRWYVTESPFRAIAETLLLLALAVALLLEVL